MTLFKAKNGQIFSFLFSSSVNFLNVITASFVVCVLKVVRSQECDEETDKRI